MPMRTLSVGGSAKLKALLLPLAISLLTVSPIPVREAGGQTRSVPLVVTAPSVFEVEAGGETLIDIKVMPEAAVPKQAIVLVRGLPSSLALSGGRLFQSGIWALRINDLESLTVAAPATPGLKSQLAISVVALDGSVLAETKATLIVAGPPKAVAKAEPAAPPPSQITTAAVAPPVEHAQPAQRQLKKSFTPEEMQSIEMLMSKGDDNMKGGQINVARLFYKRAADMGWAPGAMALASTYDTAELERIGARGGIQPDLKLAKQWYEKARELGAPDAQQRLIKLGSR
jgi:hypothetical protein